MKEEIQTHYTQYPTCPYCGWEYRDAWELHHDDDEMDCHSCDGRFRYERIVTVDFKTSKINNPA